MDLAITGFDSGGDGLLATLALLLFVAVGMAINDQFQGHIDVYLSTYAQQFRNNMLIGDTLFPRVPVGRQSDKFVIFGREELMGDGSDTRARGAGATKIRQTLSDQSYFCPDHSLAFDHEQEDTPQSQLPAMEDPRQRKTRVVTNLLLLNHEIRIFNKLSAAANFPAGNKVQLAGNDQWSSADAADQPVEDVEAGKHAIRQKLGIEANTLVLGASVWKALRNNPVIIERIKYTKLGGPSLEDIAALFDVERVLVAKAVKRSAAGVNSFIFDKDAVLLYVQPGASTDDLSFGKTFAWNKPGAVNGFQTVIGPNAPPSALSEELSVHWWHDEQIVCPEAGYLIEDAVA